MTLHIFFSWQSDTPNGVGRSLIEDCLEKAIAELKADADVNLADRDVSVDRDTLNVPGSPPIMETIFGKIDDAAVFLSDLTYVAERVGGGRTPNPNVCIEHGWALKALSWRKVIAVMNTAMGHPDDHVLPFDVRHTRRPILFSCPEDADPAARREAKAGLTRQLVVALKAIFGDSSARPKPASEPDPRQAEAEGALQELWMDVHRGGVPEIVPQPRITLRLAPFAAFEGRRLDPGRVVELQQRFPPSMGERVKTDSDSRQWWSCAVPRPRQDGLNSETPWRMRLVRPGTLEFQATIGQRVDDDPEILVDGRRLEGLIIHTLERMAGIAGGLGLDGPALASVTVEGTEDVMLMRARPGGRRMREQQVHLAVVRLPDLAAPLAGWFHNAFDILWQSAGWAEGAASFSGGVWAGYQDRANYGGE